MCVPHIFAMMSKHLMNPYVILTQSPVCMDAVLLAKCEVLCLDQPHFARKLRFYSVTNLL